MNNGGAPCGHKSKNIAAGDTAAFHFSLFVIHYSLKKNIGMLPAGFRIGSSNAKEAAPRRVLRMLGVLRQPPPEGIARGGCPAFFRKPLACLRLL